METREPYQILKVEILRDNVNYRPVIALVLVNAFRRIIVIVDTFPNFVLVEIPEYGSKNGKWTQKEMGNLLKETGVDLEFSFKYRRKYYGYSDKTYPFITLYSYDTNDFDDAVKKLKEHFVKIYISINKNIDAKMAKKRVEIKQYFANFSLSQKFYAVTGLNPGNWVIIDGNDLEEFTEPENDEDEPQYQTEWSYLPTYRLENYRLKKLEGYPPAEYLPNFRVLCLDFEVNSSRKGQFPDPWEPDDEIYLVSVVISEYRTGKKYGKIIVDKDLPIPYVQNDDESDPSKVVTVRNEVQLLKNLEKSIRKYDPDFITGYNVFLFDFPYWKARYDSVGEKLGCFGRFIHHPCYFKANNWSSSAHVSRNQELLVVPGACVFDLYVVTRRDKFYDIYTLDFVSSQVLGEKAKKDEVSAEEQFRIYREGTTDEWKKLLHYSLRDSWAPLQIIDKWNTLTMLLVNASIIGINVDDIYSRGQQYRLENMVFQRLLPKGIVINPPKGTKGEKYKGAIVQNPVLGLIELVGTLDFNSLYPTIMIHFNISHDTFIGTNIEDLPDGLTWDDVHKIYINPDRYHVFVKRHIKEGAFPELLKVLLDSRAAKKNQMKAEIGKDNPDQVIIDNLDAEQLCLKVIANSGYGLLGAREGGKLPLPEGAESVTAMGRELITSVVEHLKEKYNAQIIYGDSVTGDTPILLRRDGKIEIKTIETIGKKWKRDDTFKPWLEGVKEHDTNIDYEVWTEKGWVKIKRVIRHYTNKSIYEVMTQTGYVKVTEDHSLLKKNGEEVTPNECAIGTELLHSFPESINKNNELESVKFITDSQISAQVTYLKLRQDGRNVTITKTEDKFILNTVPNLVNDFSIKHINNLGSIEGYVYDLETDNGHFHAGVGQLIVHNTDSVFFRLPEWTSIQSEQDARERIQNIKSMAHEVTSWINKPPIKIALDHVYLNYVCVKKKCYFSNEIVEVEKSVFENGVERKETRLAFRFSYKGVPIARREHTKWLKLIYKKCAMIALGRCSWEDQSLDMKTRKWNFELALWEGVLELMCRQVPWEHLYKISQISKTASEYKSKSYPLRLFLEREEREGRPLTVGERFKWLRVRQYKKNPLDKNEKLYAGNAMRRHIEDGEYLDEEFYLNSLKMPMRRIAENVFTDKTMYTRMLVDIKTKRQYLEELVGRPWPEWTRKAKATYLKKIMKKNNS